MKQVIKFKTIKEKYLLDLWAEAVKIKYDYKCAYCGKTNKQVKLNSHHIFSRRHKATRYDLENGICLCVGHHKFYPFSAHESPAFVIWMVDFIGQEKYNELKVKANQIKKWTEKEKREIAENLKWYIKNTGEKETK